MSRFRYAAAGATAVAAAGLLTLGLTASSAFAGQTPGGHPTPSCEPTVQPLQPYGGDCKTTKPPEPTPTVTTPPPVVTPFLRQQEFDLLENNLLPNGWVLGTGPISIVGGVDRPTSNPRVDFFDTSDNASGVRINHEPLAGSVIDRVTCSITVSQADLPWSIHQGFGVFAGATGNGFYDLEALFSFPTRHNHCTLPFGLTSGQADWDLNNGSGLPQPLAFSVSVQAVGRAAVVRHHHKPVPEPSRSIFAPTAG
jgi:hypothetical protein